MLKPAIEKALSRNRWKSGRDEGSGYQDARRAIHSVLAQYGEAPRDAPSQAVHDGEDVLPRPRQFPAPPYEPLR